MDSITPLKTYYEVKKVAHYWLKVGAMKRPMMVQENKAP